ncbi:hypothetical protein [Blastococcus sp. SYSU D00695]
MRKKLIIAGTAGALTLVGLGVALPALADGESPAPGASSQDRIRDALAGLVDDGSITQEQADEVAATLSDAGIGDHGGHGSGFVREGLSTAAETLGMTEEELRTALQADGASLASVAQEEGVDVQTLVDALVRAATDRIDQAVSDGRLTQADADQVLADLEQRITDRVHRTDLLDGPHGDGHGRHRGWHGPHGGDDGD